MNDQYIAPIQKKALGALTVYLSLVSLRMKGLKSRYPEQLHAKNGLPRKDTEVDKLRTIVDESSDILAHARSTFPFVFPINEIIVDRHKLTIIYKMPLNIAQKISVPIEDIKNVQANFGLLFGSLTITSDHFVNNIQKVEYLPLKSTAVIQRLVQGAVVATKETVNISKIEPKDLRELLTKLGESETPN